VDAARARAGAAERLDRIGAVLTPMSGMKKGAPGGAPFLRQGTAMSRSGAKRHMMRLREDPLLPVPLQLAIQGTAADPERFRCRALVPLGLLEHVENVLSLETLEIPLLLS